MYSNQFLFIYKIIYIVCDAAFADTSIISHKMKKLNFSFYASKWQTTQIIRLKIPVPRKIVVVILSWIFLMCADMCKIYRTPTFDIGK